MFSNFGITKPCLKSGPLANNQADMIAVGRAALVNQNWPEAIKKGLRLKAFNYDMFNPIANLDNADTYFKLV